MQTPIFVKNKNIITVDASGTYSVECLQTIPPGIYVIEESIGGLILKEHDDFILPKRLYGDTAKRTERFINTFKARPGKTTGVLLNGVKGSGKSLQAKHTAAVACAAHNMPCILVNTPLHDEAFKSFVGLIKQPCVMFFDEFEKVYEDQSHQQDLLSMLDGTQHTNKLFLFTTNDKQHLNVNLINRPGRIFYSIQYDGVTDAEIKEYCEENLYKDNYERDYKNVCTVAKMFKSFNFDMLQALIEEVNRYKEDPLESVKYLNIVLEEESQSYTCVLTINENGVEREVSTDRNHYSPIFESVEIWAKLEQGEDAENVECSFAPKDMVFCDIRNNTYLYKKGNLTLRATGKPNMSLTAAFNQFAV